MSTPEEPVNVDKTSQAPDPHDDNVVETPTEAPEAESAPEPSRWGAAAKEIVGGSAMVSVLSVLLAFFVGSLMILATDANVRNTATYLFDRPNDFAWAVRISITEAYSALFRGAVFNGNGNDLAAQWKPLTETMKFAGPLIMAGLGVGLAFRAGLFNIGGRGQMLLGGAAAGWFAISVDLPAWLHLPLSVVVGMAVGALWAGIAGLLKATSGAHEVIVTIMLNWIAYYLLLFALSRQGLLQAPGSGNPKSAAIPESARLPKLFGDGFNVHYGFVLALVAVAVVWWLLNKSAIGFRFRAVGENPSAARSAGINVGRTYVSVMLVAGALLGLAGVNQVLGTVTSGVAGDLDAGIGFDAITVALLGRSRPLGIMAAGLLFGALKAGGFLMATSVGIPVEIVLVIQSLIVLFIAAPPLVRAIFRLPTKEATA